MKRLLKVLNVLLISSAVSLATFVIAIFIAIFLLLNVESTKQDSLKKKAALPKGSISDISAAMPKSSQEILPEPAEPVEPDSKYQNALRVLAALAVIESDVVKSPPINICEIICGPAHFKMSQKDFMSFYNDEGRRSFEDPEFRLQLESLFLVKQLFPPETLQTISNIKDTKADGRSLSEQLFLSLKIEGQVLREIYSFSRRCPMFLAQNKKIKFIKNLRKQCSSRDLNELKAACNENGLGA